MTKRLFSSSSSSSSSIAILVIINIIAVVNFSPVFVHSLGSGSTIAVSYGSASATVCGIIAGEHFQRIQCYTQGHTISILPDVSFQSISGGRNFFCGLRSDGYSLHCWDTGYNTRILQAKRIYYGGDVRLTDLTVGDDQVCALEINTGVANCWRGGGEGESSFQSPEVAWKFRTITSGKGFSCGILKNDSRVLCWGKNEFGAEIEGQFGNLSMASLVAGESHACGLTTAGVLVCKGNNNSGQLNVPSNSSYQYSGLALGANHSCAIQKRNGTVICWGVGKREGLEFDSNATKNVSFESIVAGLDFTCGLTTRNLSMICWGPGWSNELVNSSSNVIPLPMVIPGPCVVSSCSNCGIYPDSEILCDGNGNICRSCDIELPIAVPLPPIPALPSPSQALQPPSSSTSGARNRLFLPFIIVGSVGSFAGFCSIIYCLLTGLLCGFCHKKIQDSLQPNNTAANVGIKSGDGFNNVVPSRSSSIKTQVSWGSLKRQRSGTSSSKHGEGLAFFSLSELATATENFSPENKIGGGSFGTVYRGKLADGREVAIKRGETNSKTKKFQEKESSFSSELALLSRLHHKHLVELVGFCQEKDERVLVYEYMSNGALHDHLHCKENNERNSSVLNSWKMRIKIALETARGIEYLHNYAVPPIIHRDIKSSNILLDENWTAKVSDFGLSLMGPESDEEFIMSTKAVGTVGYIDPEYYVLNILTAKSDIYGLGVVLLELLTGKRAVFKSEEDGMGPMSVVDYAVSRISAGELWKLLDMRVGLPEMKDEVEAVELVAYIAVSCVNLEGKDRPNMTDIVANLETALALCEESYGTISTATLSSTPEQLPFQETI